MTLGLTELLPGSRAQAPVVEVVGWAVCLYRNITRGPGRCFLACGGRRALPSPTIRCPATAPQERVSDDGTAGTTPCAGGEDHFRLLVGRLPVERPPVGGLAEVPGSVRKSCKRADGLLPGRVATFGRVPVFFAISSSSPDGQPLARRGERGGGRLAAALLALEAVGVVLQLAVLDTGPPRQRGRDLRVFLDGALQGAQVVLPRV